MANIDGSPLVVGGSSPDTKKVEIYDISTNKWTVVADYPYHNQYVFIYYLIFVILLISIHSYATVTTSQGAWIIGGRDNSAADAFDVTTVACYNTSGWSRLDDLQGARRGHRAIINGDKIYVVGGTSTQ